MVARYQDGRVGRFISVDPLFNDIGKDSNYIKERYNVRINEYFVDPQGMNSYSYVKNNPLRYVDPTGAYGEDVHYDLTKYLAQKSGFSSGFAGQIASWNQWTDDNPSTAPVSGSNVMSGATNKYHFADRLNTASQMYDLMRDNSLGKADLVSRFGTLLHTFQDTYSHAGLNQFTHPFYGNDPDYTNLNPQKALEMSRQSFMMLRELNMLTNGSGGVTVGEYRQQSINIWNSIQTTVNNYLNLDNKNSNTLKNMASQNAG